MNTTSSRSIPNWNTRRFDTIAEIANGMINPTDDEFLDAIHVGLENIESGTGRIVNPATARELGLISSKYPFDDAALVYSKIRPNLNKVCMPDFSGICSADAYPIWTKTDVVIKEYLFYFMISPAFLKQSVPVSMRTGMPKINRADLGAIRVPVPPLPEQQKIAAILSTWDRAIELTEKLIAAKQKRKQSLMQQLLTGKVRLPGFNQEWSVRKAGDLFGSRSVKKHPDEPVLSVTQDQGVVRRDELDRKISMDETTTGTYKLVEPEDFVISLRSFQGGLEMSRIRGIVSPAYHVIRPKVKLDSEYFRHFFKSAEFIGRLAVAIIGIRDGKQIAFGDFSFLNFRFPPVEEQAEIGRGLTLAENEIELLQKKSASLQAQKKGLMQQLLTGNVRVNVDAEAVKG